MNQAIVCGGRARPGRLGARLFGRIARGALALAFAISGSLLALTAPGEAQAQSASKSKVAASDKNKGTARPAPRKTSGNAASKPQQPRKKQVASGKKPTGSAAPATRTVPVKAAATAAVAAGAAAARPSIGQVIGLHEVYDPLSLHSSVALAVDAVTGEVLFEKNARAVLPIASISKLMTAMVVLDAGLPLDEQLSISNEDIDTEKFTRSRLRPGTVLTRDEMLHLALMASENRAANALGRHYPGGLEAFVGRMNEKARELGMETTWFVEPTGLSSRNVSSALDLAKLVRAASKYPLIREYSTAPSLTVSAGPQAVSFRNTNRLVSREDWDIGLQKTGYISEAGNCLVMQARVEDRPVVLVLLDATGKLSRFGDAQRLRNWIEGQPRSDGVPRAQAVASRDS